MQQLQPLQDHDGEPAKGKKRGRARDAPKFDLRTQRFMMCGVDLTRMDKPKAVAAAAHKLCAAHLHDADQG